MSTRRSILADDEDASAPIFQGAIRGCLLWGCDERILLFVVFLLLFGGFSGAGLYSLLLWVGAVLAFVAGRLLGSFSPYALDDLGRYLELRLYSWTGKMADDASIGSQDAWFTRYWTRPKVEKKRKAGKPNAATQRRRAPLIARYDPTHPHP